MEWNRKPVFGIGINDVKTKTKGTKPYLVWKSMLARCYSDYTQSTNPAYIGCSVCDDWLTFSHFKEWFDANYKEGTQLDKDILVKGNKVYSPETCCFVPQKVNKIFKGHRAEKSVSVGVTKQYYRYRATFRADGQTFTGWFDNLHDAEQFYSEHRRKRLLDVAREYLSQGLIDNRIYQAIISYGN
jgi:hypothetical protein